MSSKNLGRELSEFFHLDEFLKSQKQIIEAVLKGEDVLAVLPTGAGKSLCYQLPAVELKGVTVVVSPLISLMRDQHAKLTELSIPAAEFNSAQTGKDKLRSEDLLKRSMAKIIFVTPERLAKPEFLARLKKQKVSLLVVDEAHCISQWGHDFRPAYQKIGAMRARLGRPPILALTATATPRVSDEITKLLRMREPAIFRTGIMRKNLRFTAKFLERAEEKMTALLEYLQQNKGEPTLIYVSSVKTAEELRGQLKAKGFAPLIYHGRMKRAERVHNQDEFMARPDALMIATSAFGMGIDKADIRHVIHFQVPGSLEAYYQEAGRAGRDGKRAECALLYLKKDLSIHRFFLGAKYPRPEEIEKVAALFTQNPDAGLEALAAKLKISKSRVNAVTAALVAAGIDGAPDRNSKRKLKMLITQSHEREEQDRERIKQLTLYAETALCRWHHLRKYFGEAQPPSRCRTCDNCLKYGAREFDRVLTNKKENYEHR